MKRITLLSTLTALMITSLNAQTTQVASGLGFITDMTFNGNDLYIADFTNDEILKIDVNQSNPVIEVVLNSNNNFINDPRGIAFRFNEIYICNSNNVRKYDLDDVTNSNTLFFNAPSGRLIIDGDALYIGRSGQPNRIDKFNLANTSQPQEFINTSASVEDIKLDNGSIYIAEGEATERVSKFNVSDITPNIINVINNIGDGVDAIAISNQTLYLASNINKIYSVNLSSSTPQLLEIATISSNASVTDLEIKDNDLYISESGNILKLNLNTLSIQDLEFENDFKIYPNPTKGILNINTKEANPKLQIFDITGKKLLTSYGKSVDISELKSGMYFISVNDTYSKKIIKI